MLSTWHEKCVYYWASREISHGIHSSSEELSHHVDGSEVKLHIAENLSSSARVANVSPKRECIMVPSNLEKKKGEKEKKNIEIKFDISLKFPKVVLFRWFSFPLSLLQRKKYEPCGRFIYKASCLRSLGWIHQTFLPHRDKNEKRKKKKEKKRGKEDEILLTKMDTLPNGLLNAY